MDYDGVNPNLKWNNTMWRGTLADADMRVGETYYLAEFGTASKINTNVRFLDADMRIIPDQPPSTALGWWRGIFAFPAPLCTLDMGC